jgi:hypothetical protein
VFLDNAIKHSTSATTVSLMYWQLKAMSPVERAVFLGAPVGRGGTQGRWGGVRPAPVLQPAARARSVQQNASCPPPLARQPPCLSAMRAVT